MTAVLSSGSEFLNFEPSMLSGSAFRETDTATRNLVAVFNQTFAKQFFLGKNPLGYHLAFSDSPMVWREIVGVVSDFRQRNPEEDFLPLGIFRWLKLCFRDGALQFGFGRQATSELWRYS